MEASLIRGWLSGAVIAANVLLTGGFAQADLKVCVEGGLFDVSRTNGGDVHASSSHGSAWPVHGDEKTVHAISAT